MARVASFATSNTGQFYLGTCERFGLDPAGAFADDVVAFNLRAALILAAPKDEPHGLDDSTGVVTDLDAQIRAMG